ncbi:MAG: helix-turn-helix domain-containing protein [Candidatus Aenigmatarchaeota archaeon]
MATTLNLFEKRVLEILLEHDYFLTTTEVSKKSKISWNTAKKYLEGFLEKGWIEHKTKGNRDLWKANPPSQSE